MRRVFLALCLIATFTIVELPSQATASYVTLILRNIATNDFDEWKVKSSQQCTQTTGKIRQDSEDFEETWYVGQAGSEIRFWWSRLSGEADATVLVNNVVVFKGRCMHAGNGTVRMIDTCAYPLVYKTRGGGPYLLDRRDCNATHVLFATSMSPPHFGNR